MTKVKLPRKLTIEIGHLPYPELSPNSRVHFMVKARVVAASREEVGWLAKALWQGQQSMGKARISYMFYVKDGRRRDVENLLAMTKPWPDGLVDGGVLIDDDSKHLSLGECRIFLANENKSVIIVEEA